MHFGYVEYIFHLKYISLHIIFYSHLFVLLTTLIYLLDASSRESIKGPGTTRRTPRSDIQEVSYKIFYFNGKSYHNKGKNKIFFNMSSV